MLHHSPDIFLAVYLQIQFVCLQQKIHASSVGVTGHLFGTFQVLQKHFMCSNNITEFIKTGFQ